MGIVSRERSVLPTVQTGLSKHICVCAEGRQGEASVLVGSTGGSVLAGHIYTYCLLGNIAADDHMCAQHAGKGRAAWWLLAD